MNRRKFVGRMLFLAGLSLGTFVPIAAATTPSLGLNQPSAMGAVGSTLWIANEMGSSVTVVNSTTGAFVATISAHTLGVGRPDSIVVIGPNVFIASQGGPISEISSARQHIRTIHPTGCTTSGSTFLGAYGTRLVELCSNGVFHVIDSATGRIIRTITSTTTTIIQGTALVMGRRIAKDIALTVPIASAGRASLVGPKATVSQ